MKLYRFIIFLTISFVLTTFVNGSTREMNLTFQYIGTFVRDSDLQVVFHKCQATGQCYYKITVESDTGNIENSRVDTIISFNKSMKIISEKQFNVSFTLYKSSVDPTHYIFYAGKIFSKEEKRYVFAFFRNGTSYVKFKLLVRCLNKLYGINCNEECQGDTEHYSCDKNGNKICASGWLDARVNCRKKDACKFNPCKHSGTCYTTKSGELSCLCPLEYTGKFCERIAPCSPVRPCKNNGICVTVIPNHRKCICDKSNSGQFCHKSSPRCIDLKCHRGTSKCVVNHLNESHCLCNPGIKGKQCTDDINECRSNPCENNGKCINTFGGFRCNCSQPFFGFRCEYCNETRPGGLCPTDAQGDIKTNIVSFIMCLFEVVSVGIPVTILVVRAVINKLMLPKKKYLEPRGTILKF